jgi:sugar transferase (PEP-CTERM system associated)
VFSSLRRQVSAATLVQLCADLAWLGVAVGIALYVERRTTPVLGNVVVPVLFFALLLVSINGALGAYRHDRKLSILVHAGWLLAAFVVAIPVVYVVSLAIPEGEEFRDIVGIAGLAAFGGLIVLRHAVVGPLLDRYANHHILVLGTGPDAHSVEASLASGEAPNLRLVGFYPLEKVREVDVSPRLVLAPAETLATLVERLQVHEIIVGVRQQRGGVLPLRELLDCRLGGVRITDLARFFERVHGRVPIESVKASWLIYGDGFRQSWLRRLTKRSFDIVVSLAMLIAMAPVMVLVALLISMDTGAPIIYRQERIGYRGKSFVILKFRSMRQDAEKEGTPRWAAQRDSRTTTVGRLLRQTRLDELPQLLNVLRGEMSFVGPRPERPPFVSMLTEQIPFYAVRHSVKPGITGWAQVRYSYGASVEDSAKKLEYDLYYVKNNTLLLDLQILLETIRVVLLREGAR